MDILRYIFDIHLLAVFIFVLYLKLRAKWCNNPVCLLGKTVIVTGSNKGKYLQLISFSSKYYNAWYYSMFFDKLITTAICLEVITITRTIYHLFPINFYYRIIMTLRFNHLLSIIFFTIEECIPWDNPQ